MVTLSLPALRERRGDIPLLAEHFLAKHAESLGERMIAPDAMERLAAYEWPGNVRELENVIQRAMVMASAGVILPEHLPIGPVSAAAAVSRHAPCAVVMVQPGDKRPLVQTSEVGDPLQAPSPG